MPADINWQVFLRSDSMAIRDGGGLFNGAEHCFCRLGVLSKEDHNLACVAVCSPKIVVVVTADCLWKTVLRSKQINGSGLPVVSRQDHALLLIGRWKVVVNLRDSRYHTFPPQHVRIELVELSA